MLIRTSTTFYVKHQEFIPLFLEYANFYTKYRFVILLMVILLQNYII
jgi:hypothetical protein